ncbi:MAG: LysM peptidoglycan-binding domain-containing protein [Acidobacteria bacterium]|nr:LysM peptidoglycan-binding domain-containing protein [Acidobacteriota bacterium]HMU34477.1 LysM domain-containing protein [Pyrinomonadaceae bacterium]
MGARSISPYERFGTATPSRDARLIVHVVTRGETISQLADRYLGDWRLWREIASRNKVLDVRAIAPGTELVIPSRPLEKGRYESL